MKQILLFFALLFVVITADAQRRPDQFTKKSTAVGTDEIYSQAGGTGPYRITFDTARLFFIPDIYQMQLDVSLDSTGTNVTDSMRGRFVLDASGTWWYVDGDKTAVQITTTDAGDPDQNVSSEKVSNTVTITLSGSGSNTSFSVADADSSATNETITALTFNGIELGITEAGSKTTVNIPQDTVYALTYITETSGIASPRKGDIAVNSTGDTLAVYNGATWATFAGGGSVEEADGTTIAGAGTSGDPFRVDTTTISSVSALQDTSTAIRSAITTAADGATVDNLTQSNDTLRVTEGGTVYPLKLTKYTYTTDAVSDILTLRLTNGSVIETRGYTTAGDGGGARYLIQADTVAGYATDSVAVIPLASGNYAVLEKTIEINVDQFGAVPDDGTADDTAIQKALNWAINTGRAQVVRFSGGEYDLATGVVAAKINAGTYSFFTLEISGAVPAYGTVGKPTTLDVQNADGFGIAVMLGKRVKITNFFFKGRLGTFTSKEIIENTLSDWGGGTYRTDQYSPYSGIVVDAFASTTPGGNQYPDFTAYYTHATNSGSSSVTVEDCSFTQLIVGLMANPSFGGAIQNGDNIALVRPVGTYLYTLFGAGQTQSKGNYIEDLVLSFCGSIFNSYEFGAQNGNAPRVNSGNVAGTMKYLFVNGSNFGQVVISNLFAEVLWSIGYNLGNFSPTQLINCQLNLMHQFDVYNTFAPPFAGYGRIFSFESCSIAFGENCGNSRPLFFAAGDDNSKVAFSNCHTRGMPIRQLSNTGGEIAHQIEFFNTYMECEGETITSNNKGGGLIISNIAKDIVVGGNRFNYINGTTEVDVEVVGATYYDIGIGSVTPDVDSVNATAQIIFTNADQKVKAGDVLLTSQTLTTVGDLAAGVSNFRGYLGIVTSVSGDTINVEHVPHGITETAQSMFVIDFFEWMPPVYGDVAGASNLITNVVTTSSQNFSVGQRIRARGIADGVYVTAVSNDTLTISANATNTTTGQLLYNAQYNQHFRSYAVNPATSPGTFGYVRGDRVTFYAESGQDESIVSRGGVGGSAVAPEFKQLGLDEITENYAPKGTADGSLTDSRYYDNGTSLGLGTASPTDFVTINSGAANAYVRWHNNSTGATSSDGFVFGINSGGSPLFWNYETSNFRWNMNGGGSLEIENGGTDKLVVGASLIDVKDDLQLEQGLQDKDGNLGTSGQLLSSTGTQTDWVDASTVGTDNQTVDTLSLSGTTLTLALEGDNEAPYTVDLAGLQDGNGIYDGSGTVPAGVVHADIDYAGVATIFSIGEKDGTFPIADTLTRGFYMNPSLGAVALNNYNASTRYVSNILAGEGGITLTTFDQDASAQGQIQITPDSINVIGLSSSTPSHVVGIDPASGRLYSTASTGTGTDDQTLSFTSPSLSIEDGNSVDLSALDTLDALSMGGNIALNGNYLSGDGGSEGVTIGSSGQFKITSTSNPALSVHNSQTTAGTGQRSGFKFTNEVTGQNFSDGFEMVVVETDGSVSFTQRENARVAFYVNATQQMWLDETGNTSFGIEPTPTAKLHIDGATGYDLLRLEDSYTPTSSADTNGNTGDIAWDVNYIYVKTGSGWKRAALSTF